MELRQIQYAVQIAMEKNFSRAAQKLHIAQPSLSQQVSKLEKELGVLLFHRNTNSVELTHAGSLFVEKGREILDKVEQLKIEMEDLAQMRKGKLIIGSLPITGSHILPLVLPVFKSRYPNIDISLTEDTTSHLETLASNGQTDFCLLTLPLQNPALDYQSIMDDEIWLAVPPNHDLAKAYGKTKGLSASRTVPISALKEEPFIVLKKGQGFRQITLELCEKAGFSPRIVFESSNIDTVSALVATGMGIAFVPSMVAKESSGRLIPAYFPLQGHPKRTIVIAYRRGRYLSKAAHAFIETMKEVMQKHSRNMPGIP